MQTISSAEFHPLTNHAGMRMQQRHISSRLVDVVISYGRTIHARGAKSEDLRNVENALNEVWGALFPSGMPERCLMAIEKDIKRLERGG